MIYYYYYHCHNFDWCDNHDHYYYCYYYGYHYFVRVPIMRLLEFQETIRTPRECWDFRGNEYLGVYPHSIICLKPHTKPNFLYVRVHCFIILRCYPPFSWILSLALLYFSPVTSLPSLRNQLYPLSPLSFFGCFILSRGVWSPLLNYCF